MEISELYNLYKLNPIVSTDTRKIEKDSLFFALKGDNFNGNKFAKKALEEGASYSIIDEEEFNLSNQYILVDDVLKTLQKLANYHRKKFNIPFIGITGSNGKTTTKELISSVLCKKYKISATKGNLNNHIGVPLTLLSIPFDCEIAIIEMGANHMGEIKFLCNICEPNFGIITNIGMAHIEGFGSKEGVKKGKNELYQFIKSINGKVFVNQDDPVLLELASAIDKHTYGQSEADCSAQLLSSNPVVEIEWNNTILSSNLYGSYNFPNILAGICIGSYFNVSPKDIQKAVSEYESTNNRSQLIKINSNTIFLDAYNANPTSMNAAIATFSENKSSNKLMFLGDMLELGNISQEEHQKIVDKAHSLNISTVLIGKEFNQIENKYGFIYLKDYNKLIDWLKMTNPLESQILIKGSRGIRLEKVIEYLQQEEAK